MGFRAADVWAIKGLISASRQVWGYLLRRFQIHSERMSCRFIVLEGPPSNF